MTETPKAKKNPTPKRHRFHPLKAEEALRFFMQVNPANVKAGIRRLLRKRVKASALPTG
jgi:hypothetical protein